MKGGLPGFMSLGRGVIVPDDGAAVSCTCYEPTAFTVRFAQNCKNIVRVVGFCI